MSKVLLFTHKKSIDGVGCVLLAKLAFSQVDYVLCDASSIQDKIRTYLDSGRIYEYDKIFVTNLWVGEPMFTEIEYDENLNHKFYIFDHHRSSFIYYRQVPFKIILQMEDEKGLCSATSLFYRYLTKKGLLRPYFIYFEFVEHTRQYDTGEWRTVYRDETGMELARLFEACGPQGYIDIMYEKLSTAEYTTPLTFSSLEMKIIRYRKRLALERVRRYANQMVCKEINGYKVGVVLMDYEHRNEFRDYLADQDFGVDFVAFLALDNGIISYRSVKDDAKVRKVVATLERKKRSNIESNMVLNQTVEQAIFDWISEMMQT